MDSYEKYYKFNEYVGNLKLDSSAIGHFEEMFKELEQLHDAEAIEELNEEQKNKKTQLQADLDSFIKNFVEGKRNNIENKIDGFKKKVEALNDKFNEIQGGLVLDSDIKVDISQFIKELNNELAELISEAKGLISEIDEFKKYVAGYDSVEFTMNYHDINKTLKSLQAKMKEIKQKQIDLYNARVEYLNKKVAEIKNMNQEGLSPEMIDMINGLTVLDTCKNINAYTDINYLNNLDYQALIQLQANVVKVENGLTLEQINLDAEIEWIETRLNEIDGRTAETMKVVNWNLLEDELSDVCRRIVEFNEKIINNKDLIPEDLFKKYEERINDAQIYAAEINNKISNGRMPAPLVVGNLNNEYEEMKRRVELLNKEVVNFSNLIEALYSKVTIDGVVELNKYLSTYENRLDDMEKEFESKHKDGKLDDNQYSELMKKVEETKKVLEDTKAKLHEPEMGKDIDAFSFLNGEIDGLEAALDKNNPESLYVFIAGLGKPIKKEDRKIIDKEFEKLEKEAKHIAAMLEKHKEEDPEKYEAAKNRLEKVNEKMEALGKSYRKNCPLHVRVVTSAKNFYKKHPKTCLLIAGLAAIALIHVTVGPVLIPAIMHGNVMLSGVSPALGGFTSFVNGILGPISGATNVQGYWYLSNGVKLMSSSAGITALLKGIAVAGMGTAAIGTIAVKGVKNAKTSITSEIPQMISSLVSKVKGLSAKVKKHELKEKLTEEEKKKKEKTTGKKKVRQADKMSIDELAKLMKEFRKSGKTLDEFCAEKEISEEEKAIIQYLDGQSKKNEQDLENTGKRGR